MSNYRDYDAPVSCPYCGDGCHADFVDVGVGMVQCGPYHCESCGASEIGPERYDWAQGPRDEFGRVQPIFEGPDMLMREGHPFTDRELDLGWYDPATKKMSPYANTSGGVLVDHQTAKELYDVGLLDEKDLPKAPESNE